MIIFFNMILSLICNLMIKNYDHNYNVINSKKIECILRKKCISILFNAFVYYYIIL